MKSLYPHNAGQSMLADAKARLNIFALWIHFNFTGKPSANCHSPFRKDAKPSFSVNADGTLWNDFASGEAGDAIDFFQRASGLSQKDACKKFIELAGGHFTPAPRPACPRPADAKPKPEPSLRRCRNFKVRCNRPKPIFKRRRFCARRWTT